MFGLDVLITVANIIYLFSYAVRDILWLRILTVVGATMLLPYYYFQVDTLWAAIAWNSVFIAINIYWIIRLLLDRRPVPLSAEERRLYQLALRNMSEREAYKLFRMGSRSSIPAETVLMAQGDSVKELTLIVEGEISVDMDSTHMDTLGEGRFVGAAAFLSKDTELFGPCFGAGDQTDTRYRLETSRTEGRIEKRHRSGDRHRGEPRTGNHTLSSNRPD